MHSFILQKYFPVYSIFIFEPTWFTGRLFYLLISVSYISENITTSFSQQLYTAYKFQNIYKIFADPLCLWTNWIGPGINIKGSGIISRIILLYKIIRYYETKKEQRKKPLLFYYFCTIKPETPLTKIYSVFAIFKLWRYWWNWKPQKRTLYYIR